MANRKMKMAKPKARVVEPSRKAVYKKRIAKPEADDIPAKPRKRSNFPKGFI